jgi:hypothetical protein
MILAPSWSWTRRIAGSPLIVLPALAVYLVAVLPILPEFAAEMLRPDLAGVRDLLSTADGTAAVWAHLPATVGRRDGQRRRRRRTRRLRTGNRIRVGPRTGPKDLLLGSEGECCHGRTRRPSARTTVRPAAPPSVMEVGERRRRHQAADPGSAVRDEAIAGLRCGASARCGRTRDTDHVNGDGR